jgi:hypothetical protein
MGRSLAFVIWLVIELLIAIAVFRIARDSHPRPVQRQLTRTADNGEDIGITMRATVKGVAALGRGNDMMPCDGRGLPVSLCGAQPSYVAARARLLILERRGMRAVGLSPSVARRDNRLYGKEISGLCGFERETCLLSNR